MSVPDIIGRMTKEKTVPDIPGVSRGFPAGVPIDAAAQLQVTKTKERFSHLRADIFLIDAEKVDYLKLPTLIRELPVKPPPWMPRYEPISGAVYTMRWNEPDLGLTPAVTFSKDGLFIRTETKRYLVIGGEKYHYLATFKKVAKSWDVRQLVPQRVEDGIEAAMRQQDEIMKDYQFNVGVETGQVAEVLSQIEGLFEYLNQSTVSEATFNGVALRAEDIFRRHGLLFAKDPFKTDIVGTLQKVSLKDSLGRRNPSAAKWRLVSALLKTIKRKLVTGFVNDKSVRIFSVLLTEREIERLNLEDGKRIMEQIGGFSGRLGANIFSNYFNNPKQIPDNSITQAGEFLEDLVRERFRSAKVAPYLLPARIIEAMLVGRRLDREKTTEKILTGYSAAKELDEPSVVDLLRMRKPAEALKRFSDAYVITKELLNDPDHKVYTL